ncbi:MAG TPA: FUSC family protein [Bryobacteraceae bacterium]|nr:FUSC family protein [Bryobacteraceae bacterium]
MATLASTASPADATPGWFRQFLKEEFAPYRGRLALVFRMVSAATVVMILTMTFRLPYGAYGVIYALTISRESPRITLSAVKTIVTAFLLGGAYVLAGAIFFVNEPIVRFFWVIASLFLVFYSLSAMSDYVAAARFGYLVIIAIPLWDRHLPANDRVEGTLWVVGTVGFASLITLLMELAFASLIPGDEVTRAIDERLECVSATLASYSDDLSPPGAAARHLTRLALVGTSRLRRTVARSNRPPPDREQMNALVALAGRLVDIAANLPHVRAALDEPSRNRVRSLVRNIAIIRSAIKHKGSPPPREFTGESAPIESVPLLGEMETTVSQLFAVLAGSGSGTFYALPSSGKEPSRLFVSDALTNPEHLQFGLKGCLAASLAYVAYNGLFWPGISTAVTTCFLTALSSVGASHQKQILRFAGTLVGGFGIGMLSQIFILPSIDSIAGFTVLFVAVIALSAWIATSSSRLSYFGVQLAIAFCLINLTEFQFQTSLAVARDRVVGVLLGLATMWLAFDPLWAAPGGVEMKRTFVSSLRLLAQSAREPVTTDRQTALAAIASLREKIDKGFGKVRSLADGVLFEFGPTRRDDLALRVQIRRWQPQLRTFFVMRNALIRYRLQLPGFELPQAVHEAQQEFDRQSARMLDNMADRLEGKTSDAAEDFRRAFERLQEAVRTSGPEAGQTEMAAHLETFLPLCRMTASLVRGLDAEIV